MRYNVQTKTWHIAPTPCTFNYRYFPLFALIKVLWRKLLITVSNTITISTAITSPPDSYFYTDTHGLVWDRQLTCWTKDNLAADLNRSRLSPSPPPSTVALPSSSSLDGSVSTLRMETPDLGYYHSPPPHTRPISQLSYRSEDLQTIHSQDVSFVHCNVCCCTRTN